ncbi:hypothetical protein [Streptomyces sp. NPDC048669]|uniref:hypothetical protein n=1 Tax=Streptomyces sp. NPDC048669 TaxID=3155267 RepID=UPI003437AC39
MQITLPTTVVEGIQLTVMPFRADAVIGTMSVATLVQLVPSPRREEDAKTLKAASGAVRRHAELRALGPVLGCPAASRGWARPATETGRRIRGR